MMHNGQMADPLNVHAKALKGLTGKKKKTDADHHEIARVEFFGSLYTDKTGHPVLPWNVLEASILAGAKRSKDGQRAKRAVFVQTNATLKYDGPKTAKGLWDAPDSEFVDRRTARNQMSRIVRTRPVFPKWSADIEVSFDDEVANRSELDAWVVAAGKYEGVGDYRPRHGTFDVELL
jgi:hypothetical protein